MLSKLSKKHLLYFVSVLFLLGIAYLIYDYYDTQKELSAYKDDQLLNSIKETKDLLNNLEKIAVLPQDEEPKIGTVTEAFKLRGQEFFKQAKNGDKMIFYENSGRAYLYRPEINKIVEATTFSTYNMENTPDNEDKAQNTEEKIPTPNISIHNGTLTVEGLALKVSEVLKTKFTEQELNILELKNANNTFEESLIIDVNGNYTDIVKRISQTINAKITNLPDNTQVPDNIDILLIIGTDYKTN